MTPWNPPHRRPRNRSREWGCASNFPGQILDRAFGGTTHVSAPISLAKGQALTRAVYVSLPFASSRPARGW